MKPHLPKKELSIKRITGVTWLIAMLIVILCVVGYKAQAQDCSNVIELTTWDLPYDIQECWPDQEGTYYDNPHGMLDSTYGCWYCLYDPIIFKFDVWEWSVLHMTISSNLTNPITGGESYPNYAVFDGCPFDGGTILSYPCNCNNPEGECWDEFGGRPYFIQASGWDYGCCGWSGGPYIYSHSSSNSTMAIAPFDYSDVDGQGEPPWNFANTSFWIDFGLDPGEYYIAVWPSTSCVTDVSAEGCINVGFDGILFLDLHVSEVNRVMTQEGVLLYMDGIYYDLLGRIVNLNYQSINK